MQIGILGSGNVGGTLGERWAKAGHDVIFGSREPENAKVRERVARAGGTARAGTFEDAASAPVVLAALPWPAAKDVLKSLDLNGRIVIDCMNPVRPDLSGLELGTTTSAGEQVAQWAAGAAVVKAFNTVGFNVMADPIFDGQPAAMLYCGDDRAAKDVAARLASELGFEAIDAGPLANARLLEPAAMQWIWLAIKGGVGRDFAFRLMRRS